MKKLLGFIIVLAFITMMIVLPKPYHSYSGSRYLLSQHGVLVTSKDNMRLHYYPSDSVLSKAEMKALRKLSKKYFVYHP